MPWQPTEEQRAELNEAPDIIARQTFMLAMERSFWREMARELRDELGSAVCYMPQGPSDALTAFMNRADEALR